MSDDDKSKKNPLTHLTNRERHFVEELARSPITATEAARRSYNVTTDKSAQNTASRLMKKPSVQEALQHMYEEVWPDVDRDIIMRLMSIVRDGSDANVISAVKEIAKMRGYYQPKQTQSIQAKITLPGQKKD